jgi:hypothetical protein
MKIEDKEFLAKQMGFKVHKGFIRHNDGSIYSDVGQWSPDDNPKDFTEIWVKLDKRQQQDVITELTEDDYDYEWASARRMVTIFLTETPKAMNAVLKVLKVSG